MSWKKLQEKLSKLDLQVKVVIVLFLVTAPIYFIVSFAVYHITIPVFEEELRYVGIHAATNLSQEIEEHKLLQDTHKANLEQVLRKAFFVQPNIVQIDAFKKNDSNGWEIVSSTEDISNLEIPTPDFLPINPVTSKKKEEGEMGYWEVWVPIKSKKIIGAIRLEISLQSAYSLVRAVWKILFLAGIVNLLSLLVALSYFLRKTIINDRKLRQMENKNLVLVQQLHETERQLMLNEKLAVMGQLTASFAHEMGTPLNAVNGHLQLLKDDLQGLDKSIVWNNRLEIIKDQLLKIENIVKGFLQSTAKPATQLQLTNLNSVIEKTINIVSPRIEALGIKLEKDFEQNLAPIRAVPLDIEQVLLNLLNNSIDSIQDKLKDYPNSNTKIGIFSKVKKDGLKEWIEIGVHDTGYGIAKKNINQVFKPFFTTKATGEGTGLGLTICQEIAGKYHGKLEVDSKEGMWTKVVLKIPYGVNP